MRSNPILAISFTLTATLAVVTSAFAQVTWAPPNPRTDANETAAAVSEQPNADNQKLDTVQHLRRAAAHLKAAGKATLARQVAKEMLVEEKLLQIRQLQVELEELRAPKSSDRTVRLHVKIMEVQLTKMKELGLNFKIADGLGVFDESFLSALQTNDLIKVLAEPTLVTVSGRPAAFQTGGEFPIIVPQKDGKVAIEYRHFGTRLDCMAEILDSGRIRVELRPSVSELDPSRSVTVQGMSVPALRTRWVDTAVVLEPGETIVLGGLMQTRPEAAADSSEAEETALLISVAADFGELVIQARKEEASKRR